MRSATAHTVVHLRLSWPQPALPFFLVSPEVREHLKEVYIGLGRGRVCVAPRQMPCRHVHDGVLQLVLQSLRQYRSRWYYAEPPRLGLHRQVTRAIHMKS